MKQPQPAFSCIGERHSLIINTWSYFKQWKNIKKKKTNLCIFGGCCPMAIKYSSIEMRLSPEVSTERNIPWKTERLTKHLFSGCIIFTADHWFRVHSKMTIYMHRLILLNWKCITDCSSRIHTIHAMCWKYTTISKTIHVLTVVHTTKL